MSARLIYEGSCRTPSCIPSPIDDPHLSIPRLALMAGDRHQRQNGPNSPPLFPHHAAHALLPTLSAALLTWGPLSLGSPWDASLPEWPTEDALVYTPLLGEKNPGPKLGSLHVPGPLISSLPWAAGSDCRGRGSSPDSPPP